MRIEYSRYGDYVSVYTDRQGHPTKEPQQIEQENGNLFPISATLDPSQNLGNEMSLEQSELSAPLRYLFSTCMEMHKRLEDSFDSNRISYLELTANTRYHNSMLVDEIERLDRAGVTALVDGKNQGDLLQELRHLEQQVQEWDYRNTCENIFARADNHREYATSRIFIALPCDLQSWDDSNPATHQFRLYFLCDNWEPEEAQEDMPQHPLHPQHVHLSNHPGYVIKRPQEFFEAYGDYVLKVLLIVKQGYFNNQYEIPPLDSFKILWNCDPDIIGEHLTKSNIGDLVDKAITHLQELSPPMLISNIRLTRVRSAAIEAFLITPDGNAESGLHRYNTPYQHVYWMCPAHSRLRFPPGHLQGLQEFVCNHGGHFDLQKAELKVELHSKVEAKQFRTLLKRSKYVAKNIVVKLNWKASLSEVQHLGRGIGKAGTVTLDIEGLAPDIHPRGYAQLLRNYFFGPTSPPSAWLQVVTLRNHPEPQEQCIRIGKFTLRLSLAPERWTFDWIELESDLDKVYELVSNAEAPLDCDTAARELRSTLEKHGLLTVILATIYDNYWVVMFDLEKVAFVEAHSVDMFCPTGVVSSGSLRKLGVHIHDEDLEPWPFQTAEGHKLLQELKVSHFRHTLYYAESLVKMYCNSSSNFSLTLNDRTEDVRLAAQLTIRGCSEALAGGDINKTTFKKPTHPHEQDILADIEFLQWDCDQIFSPLSDYLAAFLDMATQQHPTVLTLVTLDITRLSRAGLAAVSNILGRSSLQHLNIECTAFDSSLSDSVALVLGSVPWTTLRSLTLAGDCMDDWLQLWPSNCAPCLLRLEIQGTESTQPLSHASVLFVHQVIHASPLQELYFVNIETQEQRDWELIAGLQESLVSRNLTVVQERNKLVSCVAVDPSPSMLFYSSKVKVK